MLKRPNPYDLTKHDGKTVDWLTKAALLKMERILGYELTVTQGSYQARDGKDNDVAQSAGTHDRGGVVDLAAWDWPAKVRAGRLSGFVASFRSADEGDWPDHIHMVLECNEKLSASAERQVQAYYVGRNGLANNGPDPHVGFVFRGFHWPYAGLVGLARWKRDQLRAAEREKFLDKLRKVVRGR